MREVTVLLLPLVDGFRAVVGSTALDSYTLDGFGTRIERALRQNLGPDVDVEYSLSKDIQATLPTCMRCRGTERVEIEGTVAAQTLKDEFSAIDFSKRATDTCPRCKGLGAEIPNFWRESVTA